MCVLYLCCINFVAFYGIFIPREFAAALFALALNNQFLRIVVHIIICVVTISLSLSFCFDNNLTLVDTRMRV